MDALQRRVVGWHPRSSRKPFQAACRVHLGPAKRRDRRGNSQFQRPVYQPWLKVCLRNWDISSLFLIHGLHLGKRRELSPNNNTPIRSRLDQKSVGLGCNSREPPKPNRPGNLMLWVLAPRSKNRCSSMPTSPWAARCQSTAGVAQRQASTHTRPGSQRRLRRCTALGPQRRYAPILSTGGK